MNPPEFLGPYRIGNTIGKGGMGTVFQARHEKSGEDVAVKLIATQMSDDMRFRRRFDREIETLKLLKHPNIVRLIGYGEEQGVLFYSMEFVRGETLQDRVRRDKKIPWAATLNIAIQVCSALKQAHDFGVIHRDLKPANLLIQEDGVVKLVDFGISKLFGHDQTAAGSIMGTADYMAPEQASEGGITARTDLFALGCLIYAMICGRPPFRGKNITEVITALQTKEAVPLDMVDPELPDDIVQIVAELLEKNPVDRPPTALAVMNRLKAMKAGLERQQTLVDRGAGGKGDGAKPNDAPIENADTDIRPLSQSPSGKTSPIASVSKQPRAPEYDSADTFFTDGEGGEEGTAMTRVSPSEKTLYTEHHDRKAKTAAGTEVRTGSQPSTQDGPNTKNRTSDEWDTSTGASKTHFQTVSDGDVRESYFTTAAETSENGWWRWFSVAALTMGLAIAGVVIWKGLQSPSQDELLAIIDQGIDTGDQSAQQEERVNQFLKIYPEHARADELRRQQMLFRVDGVVNRLRLASKIRVKDAPAYEQAFLDAMDLRGENPAAAKEKLQQWLNVFADEAWSPEDTRHELSEIARFEIQRLSDGNNNADGPLSDPRVMELMQRIDAADELTPNKRKQLLQSIVTLYDGQPWAEAARQRAIERLESTAIKP